MDWFQDFHRTDLIEQQLADARKAGFSGHRARVRAFVKASLIVERNERETRANFDRAHVRSAIINGEQWSMVSAAYCVELMDALQSIRRWIIASVVILGAILLLMLL